MEIDFIVKYHAENVYHVTDLISLKLEGVQAIKIESLMIIEEEQAVFMNMRMTVAYLSDLKQILESSGVSSPKLYRECYW